MSSYHLSLILYIIRFQSLDGLYCLSLDCIIIHYVTERARSVCAGSDQSGQHM